MKPETSANFEKRHQNLSGISALSISKRSSVLGFLGDFFPLHRNFPQPTFLRLTMNFASVREPKANPYRSIGKKEKLRKRLETRKTDKPAIFEKTMIGWGLRNPPKSYSALGTSIGAPGLSCEGGKLLCCGRIHLAFSGKYHEICAE